MQSNQDMPLRVWQPCQSQTALTLCVHGVPCLCLLCQFAMWPLQMLPARRFSLSRWHCSCRRLQLLGATGEAAGVIYKHANSCRHKDSECFRDAMLEVDWHLVRAALVLACSVLHLDLASRPVGRICQGDVTRQFVSFGPVCCGS